MTGKVVNYEDLISSESSGSRTKPKLTKAGKIILGITGASFCGMCAAALPFLLPAARRICLPFVPATPSQVQNVFSLINGPGCGRLIDLGSGDGRIVIEAARRGFQAHGVELNPWLVLYSRVQALRLKLHKSATGTASFSVQDLFKHNLNAYDNIVIFGVDSLMPLLHEKLKREMLLNGQVIACRFPLPCTPSLTAGEGLDTVWLYRYSDIFGQNSCPTGETTSDKSQS